MKRAVVKPGDRFGRLVILNETSKHGNFRYFTCKCDCGNIKTIAMGALRKGVTKSCGCLMDEARHAKKPCKWGENHPYVNTRLYNIWKGIKKRCYNPNDHAYKWYVKRGIKVCEQWKSRFINFLDWATNNGYSDSLTIDRIDVDGNYQPDNCRWITIQDQQKNKRK